VVGVAAGRAALPVECSLTEGDRTWLRVGQDQYVDAAAVPDARPDPCAAGAGGAAAAAGAATGSGSAPGDTAGAAPHDPRPADDPGPPRRPRCRTGHEGAGVRAGERSAGGRPVG
jgi:hypothetical protein